LQRLIPHNGGQGWQEYRWAFRVQSHLCVRSAIEYCRGLWLSRGFSTELSFR
jgi:hypothetical protein